MFLLYIISVIFILIIAYFHHSYKKHVIKAGVIIYSELMYRIIKSMWYNIICTLIYQQLYLS